MKKSILTICAFLLLAFSNEIFCGMFHCDLCHYNCPPKSQTYRCPYCGHDSTDRNDPLIKIVQQLRNDLKSLDTSMQEKKKAVDELLAIDDSRVIYVLKMFCETSFETDTEVFNVLVESVENLMKKKGLSCAILTANSNIREMPSIRSKVVTRRNADSVCFVSENRNGWYKVYLPPWQQNWINDKSVKVIDFRNYENRQRILLRNAREKQQTTN